MFYIVVLLVLLNLFDGVSTYLLMLKGTEEANPLVAFLMDKFGVGGGLLISKIFFLMTLLLLSPKLPKFKEVHLVTQILAIVALGLYIFITFWHIYGIWLLYFHNF